jgi:ABC-type uncharacterized transport system YnjBCD ATPase subunit
MRPLLVAVFVLVVIVASTLGLVGFGQGAAEQQRQTAQRQDAVAFMTATSDANAATMIARQQADTASLQATIGGEATRSVATPAVDRAGLEATVEADPEQHRARAAATTTAVQNLVATATALATR